MHKRRVLLLIPLLISVTLCVSMGPNFINFYIKKDLLESKTYWTYSEPENVEITDVELAQYFVNKSFYEGAVYSNGYNSADEMDLTTIKEQTKEVLYKAFGEDEDIIKKVESIVDSELQFNERKIILTVIENKTMSLVFTNVIFMNGLEAIEIVYEEKTSTLFSVTYQMWVPEKVDWVFIDSFFQSLEAYSTEVLGLRKNQYMTRCMVADDTIIAYFYLEQTKDREKEMGEIDELIINESERVYYN